VQISEAASEISEERRTNTLGEKKERKGDLFDTQIVKVSWAQGGRNGRGPREGLSRVSGGRGGAIKLSAWERGVEDLSQLRMNKERQGNHGRDDHSRRVHVVGEENLIKIDVFFSR